MRSAGDQPALYYFDSSLTYTQVDEESDALACAWIEHGLQRGDRVALYLQNVPQFVIALLAAWKIGAIAVAINPMNRAREIALLLEDSGASLLVCHASLYHQVVQPLFTASASGGISLTAQPPAVMLTSECEYQTRNDARVFQSVEFHEFPAGTVSMRDAIATHRGEMPPALTLARDETAVLVYTSGTTGLPKGAMNTHGNLSFNGQLYRDWIGLRKGAPILGVAPLFHITGLVAHLAVAFSNASPLVLTCRFDPEVILETLVERKPEFTIGSITVFIALMNHPAASREHFATLSRIYSGGAPIPPQVITAFREKFGHYIHNAYGLTETSSPTHLVPFGVEAPVDPESGALAVGLAVFDVDCYIGDEDGRRLAPGQIGEIISRGPMVVPGYWNKPVESSQAFINGYFRTGDVGFMDPQGWFYVVDRKKDLINAGGYKVWPREVEDVLYGHPAIREAAVVGVPDAYRGETVKAVISLRPDAKATPDEIIAFCKDRMAAYKYPRVVSIVDDLPKTVTGKILRRELR